MNKCEVYDVTADTWTQIASLNTRRNFHTTISFDNAALYVVAGFNGGQRTNLIEKYDIKSMQKRAELFKNKLDLFRGLWFVLNI